jgi:uncharacterized damage-inducible protein DinB
MTKMPELLPHEEQKLRELLRRSDALGIAYEAVWDEDWDNVEQQAQILWALGEMSAEADERFRSYRRVLGIPDRPRKNA